MNERINGLWWKARIGYNNQNCDPEVLAKFAELIVRECITKVELRKKFAIEDGHTVDHAFDLLVYDIESHFGVEE